MIYLFTDFGLEGPYLGQVEAVLRRAAPGTPIINLFADVPPFDARGAAYLLAAYSGITEIGSVILAVVDPGVGTARDAIVVAADGRWFVGPENGLLAVVARRAKRLQAWSIHWRPDAMSDTFHGRDLFAPMAGMLAAGGNAEARMRDIDAAKVLRPEWPDDLPALVYIDRYGNAMTGMRAAQLDKRSVLWIGSRAIRHAATFGTVPPGEAFWYGNANGLVEIAVNQGRAVDALGLTLGAALKISMHEERKYN